MKKEYYVRSNVKVVFDEVKECYPRARLMYKVKFFIFSKWVEVNDCFFTDHNSRMRSTSQMVKKLISEGHRGKYWKKKQRRLNYQLRAMSE